MKSFRRTQKKNNRTSKKMRRKSKKMLRKSKKMLRTSYKPKSKKLKKKRGGVGSKTNNPEVDILYAKFMKLHNQRERKKQGWIYDYDDPKVLLRKRQPAVRDLIQYEKNQPYNSPYDGSGVNNEGDPLFGLQGVTLRP